MDKIILVPAPITIGPITFTSPIKLGDINLKIPGLPGKDAEPQTRESLEIDNIDNTSDLDKPVSNATQVELDKKVDKIIGKGLSQEDFTSADKERLSNTSGLNTGDNAINDKYSGLEDSKLGNSHNTSETAHNDIREQLSDIEAIARGKSRALVFETIEILDTWLASPDNQLTLLLGDNFYIKDVDVPDYWWDGVQKQPLETEKVDLTEYYKKIEADNKFVEKEAGKGLSVNDYTTTEKEKLAGIAPGEYFKTDQTENTQKGIGKWNVEMIDIENPFGILMKLRRTTPLFDFVQYRRASGVWTDITTEAGTTRGTVSGDILDAVGDYFILGSKDKYNSIYIDIGTGASTTAARSFEYSKGGDIWAPLTVVDGTNNLNVDGVITFEPPADWEKDSQNGSEPFYMVRIGTVSGTFSTEPTVYMVIPGDGTSCLEIYANMGDALPAIALGPNGYLDLRNVNVFTLLGTLSASVSGATCAMTTSMILTRTSLGFVSTDGIVSAVSTAATLAAPINMSPRIRQTAQGYDTGLNASVSLNWKNEVVPVVGNPATSNLVFEYGYNALTDAIFKQIMMLKSNGSLVVFGTTYGLECLTNGTITSPYTAWGVTGGFTTSSSRVNYAHNVAGGTLTQLSSNLATPLKKNAYYLFTFTTSSVVAGCNAYIDTDVADELIYLPGVNASAGTYDVVFKTNDNPTDFVIKATSTAGSFIIDTLSLKEITNGLIETTGTVKANGFQTGDGTPGVDGSFTTSDGKTVTIKNGIVIGIV